jgi:RHS repeat-associated protein
MRTPSFFNSTSQPINSSTLGVAELFAGEHYIPELGLYDLRNRFMSPELGRFLQADPVGFKGDASNLYRYCHNDPEDFSDPMGLTGGRDFGPIPRDWFWDFACRIDSGNAFQGSLSDFMQKLRPAGTDGGGDSGGDAGRGGRENEGRSGGGRDRSMSLGLVSPGEISLDGQATAALDKWAVWANEHKKE